MDAQKRTATADIELTEKGRQYAEAHTGAPGKPAGALPATKAPKRRWIGKRALAALRRDLAARVEEAIAMLDLLDGDFDEEHSLGIGDSIFQPGAWKAGGGPEGDELDKREGGDVLDEPHDAEDERHECDAVEVCGESDGAEGGLGTVRDHPVDQDDLDKYREESLVFHAMNTEKELTDPAGKARALLDTIPIRRRRFRGDNVRPLTSADINPAGGCLSVMRKDGDFYIIGSVR